MPAIYLFVTGVESIQHQNLENHVPLIDIDLGPKVIDAISKCKISKEKSNVVRTTCRDFLVTLASEIKARFPFNDEKFLALGDLRFLEPANIVSVKNVARVCNILGYSEEETVLTNNEYKSF